MKYLLLYLYNTKNMVKIIQSRDEYKGLKYEKLNRMIAQIWRREQTEIQVNKKKV